MINWFNNNNNISINIESERTFWNNIVINYYLFPKTICGKCARKSLVLNNNESIYNPIISRCSYRYCRKIYNLKEGSFFSLFPKTPVSVILIVLKSWILDEKNALEIYNVLKDKFIDFSISLVHIKTGYLGIF